MTASEQHGADVPPSRKKSWGIRFSLLSMILLITVVALSISNWQKSQQLSRLKVRTEQLSQALGIPLVTDSTKVTAIGVPVLANASWEWHVVIPEGKEYDLFVAFTHLPAEGLPEDPIHVESLTNGEVRINLSIEPEVDLPTTVTVRGRYVVPAQAVQTMLYHGLSPREASWLLHYGGESRAVARHDGGPKWYCTRNEGLIQDPEYVVTTFDPDEAIVLRRTRVYPVEDPTSDDDAPRTCAGMMVWLAPKVPEDETANP
ncbi:hypothetical protein C5Y96_00115 [Blastopirellula marina]|uniref:Uncharacterized protein n=1 Tax=Blastopirellula marina TaxID=124 RepID=A0A2S8GBK8_9BACT|nr:MULTISPECIES: hypothetical protein [Pirellulaceae]PQO41813.1 hypothetical protein C5Y96_00115 [Blastopirellula marina]RCS56365.1 hypothetical protein DTL36_00115 [Bremerella cremea]